MAARIHQQVPPVGEQPEPEFVLVLVRSPIGPGVESQVQVPSVLPLAQEGDARVRKHLGAEPGRWRDQVLQAQVGEGLGIVAG